MRNKSTSFFFLLASSSLAYVAIQSASAVLFRGEGVAPIQPFVISCVVGAVFVVAAMALIGPAARFYRFDSRSCEDGEDCGKHPDLESALKAVGAAPLKGLIYFFVLVILDSAAMGLAGGSLGLPSSGRVEFVIFIASIGMLAAAFLYVLADRLSLTTLLEARLVHYPADLRENRQQRKIFIIPLFMSVMSLLFAFSSSFLLMGRQGRAGFSLLPAILAFSVAFTIVVLFLMLSWNSNTALLYRSIIVQLEGLTQAEKNLQGRISIGSVDEMGTIAGMVNSFCAGLSDGIRKMTATYADLSSVQNRLFAGIGSASGAAKDIAASIDGALASIEKADEALEESLQDARELARHVADVAGKARDQSSRVASSSEGIESVMDSVGKLSREAEHARSKTGELAESVHAGEEGIHAVVENVNAVAARSADLGEINKQIAAVAARTNLLAMNAAIEAAHAGASGAGFSVVAEEIRILAESTAEHTRKSKESLSAILELIRKSLASAQSAGSSFALIREAALEVQSVTDQVAGAMGLEERRSKDILGLLAETDELGRGVAETAISLDKLAAAMADRLSGASASQSEAKGLARTMRDRDIELAKAMDDVNALSGRTAGLNETLATFINSFKT